MEHLYSSALQAVLQTNFSCSCCLWIIITVLRCKQYCKQTSAAVAVCGSFPQFYAASSTAKIFSCSCCLWIISTVLRCKQYCKKSSAAVALCGSFLQFCAVSSTANNDTINDHFPVTVATISDFFILIFFFPSYNYP